MPDTAMAVYKKKPRRAKRGCTSSQYVPTWLTVFGVLRKRWLPPSLGDRHWSTFQCRAPASLQALHTEPRMLDVDRAPS